MATDRGAPVPLRELGRKLRQLREAAMRVDGELTLDGITERCGWSSRQKLYRVERGDTKPTPLEIEALCKLYGADRRIEEALKKLLVDAKTKDWYYAYDDVIPKWFELYVGLEGAAERLQKFDVELIPGLLQTKDYARVLLRIGANGGDAEVERQVELRVARQTRLKENGLGLDLILNEAALHRVVGGPALMADQISEIATLGELANVSIRILPFAAGGYPFMGGSFTILSFPEDREPVTVYIEQLLGGLYFYKPLEVEPYRQIFDNLDKLALNERKSRDLMIRRAKELTSEQEHDLA